MLIHIPVAVGELFDKITILRTKTARLTDPAKVATVRRELEALEDAARQIPTSTDLDALITELTAINDGLWDIEDGKRARERTGVFDDAFIALARRVYIDNDRRAAIKRQINALTGSTLIEEKSHAG
jgi:hypothetical protein